MYLLVTRPSPLVQIRGGGVSRTVCFSLLLNGKTNRMIILCIYLLTQSPMLQNYGSPLKLQYLKSVSTRTTLIDLFSGTEAVL
jgi:hypothetical protein